MKNLRRTFTVLFAAAFSMQVLAQREDKLINQDWSFRFSHQVNASAARRVDLPHTWNAQDALGGKHDYKRGIGNYTKKIFIRPEWQGKRLFLRFEGANCVSNVFVNGKHIGEHRGGYGAFVFEITDKVEYGKENTLLVRVNNGEQLDVMPLVGDFNFYGGIYRDVHLLLTDNLCISPLDYASSGVYLIQQQVTDKQATICARVNLSAHPETIAAAQETAGLSADGIVVPRLDVADIRSFGQRRAIKGGIQRGCSDAGGQGAAVG